MKYFVYSLLLISGIVFGLQKKEITKTFKRENYSQEALILARIAWANQEDRLAQLAYEAKQNKQRGIVDYVFEGVYVAQIDAKSKTVTTHIGNNEKTILAYQELNALLHDPDITALANQYLEEAWKKEQEIKKEEFFHSSRDF